MRDFFQNLRNSYRAHRGNVRAQIENRSRRMIQMPVTDFTGSREYTFDTAINAGPTDMFKRITPQINAPGLSENG